MLRSCSIARMSAAGALVYPWGVAARTRVAEVLYFYVLWLVAHPSVWAVRTRPRDRPHTRRAGVSCRNRLLRIEALAVDRTRGIAPRWRWSPAGALAWTMSGRRAADVGGDRRRPAGWATPANDGGVRDTRSCPRTQHHDL